jgi:MarR family 2-MHQ and catechol resistance regulon transcriptional repressor
MNKYEIDNIVDNILSIKLNFFKPFMDSKGLKSLITPGTYYVLIALERNGPLSMSSIGREASMPKPNVTALIDKLILKGLAERTQDVHDRRIVNIKITKKGLKMKKEIDKTFEEHTTKTLSVLTADEVKLLSDSLNKVRQLMSKIQK